METENSDERPLSFYLFCGAVGTVLLVETVVWILVYYSAEWFVLTIRDHIYQTVANEYVSSPSQLMSSATVEEYTLFSSRLVVLLVMTTITVILVGFLLILKHWVFAPIELLLQKNKIDEDQHPEIISEKNIPANEIGLIMRSRNNLITSMDQLFTEEAMETLVQAVEAKDPYTEGHSRRVGEFGALIGQEIRLSKKKCEKIRYSGTLHDIGKIGVSDKILTKPGQLTDDEYEKVKSHPETGVQIIKFGVFDENVRNGILHHHEYYDGNGYPNKLEGDDIPLFGRILAVADAVDAMISDREYRDGLPIEVVREELDSNKGTQFDPEFADIALNLLTSEQADRLPDLFEKRVLNGER